MATAVVDSALPTAEGRDVCRAMRANGLLSPAVLPTAHHWLSDRPAGSSAGGEVPHDAGYAAGARFTVALPTG
ncbi:hypothetical protein [Streptomyces cyslabdanicus]|uniref:hypothetical protein n=1 Tax=Streptomyces cyslabdanicus TaxID=1470456 RepID=UPI004044806C